MKICYRCKATKQLAEFYPHKHAKDGRHSWCKPCILHDQKTRYQDPARRTKIIDRVRGYDAADRKRYLLRMAKGRAKRAGVPFSITADDFTIPVKCPVLGVKLTFSRAAGGIATSPSLDRLVPTRGYVPGNVSVISYRANSLKRDANIRELKALVRWLSKQEGQ